MAQKVFVQLVDDLDGKPIAQGKGETVSFGLVGTSYEIDLNDKNAAKLRGALSTYTAAARKVSASASGARGSGRARRSPEQLKAIREWAFTNGHKISDRGRIPKDVVAAYEAARAS
ncbi:Lsr2 family protein [Jiangella rhizosphaerae]|uniref:Lsr2 family protein n=1 Tax=Jiangella rhizosphaerae TaxID=2293569 RepID=A0A418KJJ6_9ACTN|nr:Lsr2 family protein [Jiangella rhizosphaerae]RIQ14409.1 Lsr2 family protein [Jiangella rhizosphaerae]